MGNIFFFLEERGLVLAPGSEEAREAYAGALCVVADTSARAISTRLVSVTVERIRARGAFLEVASGATVASIAEAAHMLEGVPGLSVDAVSLRGEVLLGPADTTFVAVVGAYRSLASNTLVTREALARTRLAVASALVGALSDGV